MNKTKLGPKSSISTIIRPPLDALIGIKNKKNKAWSYFRVATDEWVRTYAEEKQKDLSKVKEVLKQTIRLH